MGETTGISWTDHTFNAWRGCTKVSEACRNCYAETMAKRNPAVLGEWGPNGRRVIASEPYWRQPVKWNAKAQREGVRRRVFCASMADVFESAERRPELTVARDRLFDLVRDTPSLDWLVLTKRPDVALQYFSIRWRHPSPGEQVPRNLWIGVSVENQAAADERIPILLQIPAAVRFLSMEPLLGPADLSPWLRHHGMSEDYRTRLALSGEWPVGGYVEGNAGIGWVIAGGESGPKARPSHPDWIRSVRDQCVTAGVPFHFKQWGEWEPCPYHGISDHVSGPREVIWEDETASLRVGKKTAGRLLDGREWNEFPGIEARR